MTTLCLLGFVYQTTSASILLLRVCLPGQNPSYDAPWIMLPQFLSSYPLKGLLLWKCVLFGGEYPEGISTPIEIEIFYLPPKGSRYFVNVLPLPLHWNRNLQLRISLICTPFSWVFQSKPPSKVCITAFQKIKRTVINTIYSHWSQLWACPTLIKPHMSLGVKDETGTL